MLNTDVLHVKIQSIRSNKKKFKLTTCEMWLDGANSLQERQFPTR